MNSDAQQDRAVAKAHEEVASRNAKTAITMTSELKVTTEDRLNKLEGVVHNLQFELTHLHQKYNLLLSKQFDGGSTVHED